LELLVFNDNDLQQAVLAELNWEPSVNAAHVGVTANAGVISLMGHVESFFEKHEIELTTIRVRGVKAVVMEIEVRLPFDMKRGDDDIAAAAIERLGWDVSVPQDSVKITVDQGWITLTGEVDWNYQKQAAESDLHRLMGIVGVSNQITIKPQINTSNLSDDITHALHRSWFFDPKMISVSADGGRIRLSGTVPSVHDRQVAAATAWTARGVTEVENDIAVG
jgi:osmotically-inducible protein OsmY